MLARQDDEFFEDWDAPRPRRPTSARRSCPAPYDGADLQAGRHRLRRRGAGRRAPAPRPADRRRHDAAARQRLAGAPTAPRAATPRQAGRRPPAVGRGLPGPPLQPGGAAADQGKQKTTKWSDEDKVAQRLLRIFLTRWTENAQGFVAAVRRRALRERGRARVQRGHERVRRRRQDAAAWCAQASAARWPKRCSRPACASPSRRQQRMKGAKYGIDRQTEINYQAQMYNDWVNTTGAKLGGEARRRRRARRLLDARRHPLLLQRQARAHQQRPRRHRRRLAQAAHGPGRLGNAAGKAVRMEEVQVAQPPAGFHPYSKERPPGAKDIWIFSLVRASWLNAFVLWINSGLGAARRTCTPPSASSAARRWTSSTRAASRARPARTRRRWRARCSGARPSRSRTS